MSRQAFNFTIDLPMQNRWENVDLMRASILNCFVALAHETDGIHAFATIAAELLENAIKYGRWDRGDSSRLHLRVWGNDGEARVQVENPVDRSSTDVAELVALIDWLKSHRSAEAAYQARLLEVATSPKGVSKLGLARIAYEGACTLDAEIVGDVLRVTTVTRFEALQ